MRIRRVYPHKQETIVFSVSKPLIRQLFHLPKRKGEITYAVSESGILQVMFTKSAYTTVTLN